MLYFGFGSVLPKLLSMLIVPLYTACLSPAEYGTADLILSTASLFLALLTLNISEATLRSTLDRSLPREQILAASCHVLLGSNIFLGFGLLLFSGFVPAMGKNLLLLFYLTYLTLAVNSILSAYCRGTDRVAILIQSQILGSAVTFGASLLFLQDRWLLNWYHGAAAVGLYAVAFKIPSIFTAVQSVFSQA